MDTSIIKVFKKSPYITRRGERRVLDFGGETREKETVGETQA
jgi:hypothetical protein